MAFSHRFLCAAFVLAAGGASADPLSKDTDIDFFRDVASRDLQGLATRSDGSLASGPFFTALNGAAPAELLWCLEPEPRGKWLVGTGPDGRIFEVTLGDGGSFSSREAAALDDAQVFAVRSIGGRILAGTSPRGGLYLVENGKVRARAALPADSVFDIVATGRDTALVATGNPGCIYRVSLSRFAASGISTERAGERDLASRGITPFGRIRDANVRRLALLSDGRIAVGSSPGGNIYVFPGRAQGEARPLILQENSDAEVTDLFPEPDGSFLAAIVHSSGPEPRISALSKAKDEPEISSPARPGTFSGRSVLCRFPKDGFPEILAAREGAAFYRLAAWKGTVLIAGGEDGDLLGYDPESRLSLTFAGSSSARLNAMAAVPGLPGRFLVLRNNAPGFALLDFNAVGIRQAVTRKIDLETPSRLGAVRIDRLDGLADADVSMDVETSNGSDEREGWSPWTPFAATGDGWRGPLLRGRYVRVRLRLPAAPSAAQVGGAAVYYLPQNQPPRLQEFHLISQNYALVPAPEAQPPVVATLGQLLQGNDEKRKDTFLSSQVVPSPGTRVAFWTVADPDGDNLVCTFSIRRGSERDWTDIAVDTADPFAQFETSNLPEGVYHTRLLVRETAPRPAAERLAVSFPTDDFVVDHTPPVILEASARRSGGEIVVTMHGRDALSLLDGIEVVFNNGTREIVEQPVDGIRDGREETFVLEEPEAKAAGATAVDVTLYDSAGNGATRRLPLPAR